jgi:hypothetical protein
VRFFPALLLLSAVSCSKCGAPSARDGGVAVRRAVDLRTAMIATLPEWRNVLVDAGQAVLRRELDGPFDPEAAEKGFAKNGFSLEESDAGVRARRDRFVLVAKPGEVEWRMQLQADDPSRLLSAPNVMSTENMATWFPPELGEERRETFTLTMGYSATPQRVEFLTRQLFDLSTRGTWTAVEDPHWPDAGQNEHWRFVLVDKATTARLTCTRDGDQVGLEYVLVTFERR